MTKTTTEKQRTRRQRLNELATEVGYKSWSELETAVLNGDASIVKERETTMDARIITKRIDSQNSKMVLRAGKAGRGKDLFAVNYWPDSPRSVEQADEYIFDYANRHGYTIHGDSDE